MRQGSRDVKIGRAEPPPPCKEQKSAEAIEKKDGPKREVQKSEAKVGREVAEICELKARENEKSAQRIGKNGVELAVERECGSD